MSLNDQIRHINATATTRFYEELRPDLITLPFLPVHSPLISFFSSSSNALPNQSIVLFDNSKGTDGLVFFSEPLMKNAGLLIHILNIIPSNESRLRTTTAASISNLLSSHIQFGLTNCNTKTLLRTNDLPLDVEQTNHRSEFWIIQDLKLGNKTSIDRDDEFLFTLNEDGIVEYSQNNSKLKEFIHVDSNLIYYPFLVFKGDIVAIRSMGYVTNLNKYRSFQQINQKNDSSKSNQELTSINNNPIKTEHDSKLNEDCTVCFDRMRDTVLIPCGHICLCYSCAKELLEHGTQQCKYEKNILENFKIEIFFLGPICRSSITLINKIYLA
jgi:hypothetical protein